MSYFTMSYEQTGQMRGDWDAQRGACWGWGWWLARAGGGWWLVAGAGGWWLVAGGWWLELVAGG